jgi:hypothetical protein
MENAKMSAEQPTVLLSLKNRMKESVMMLREINIGMDNIERRLAPQVTDEGKVLCEKSEVPEGLLAEMDYVQIELATEILRYKRLYERFSQLM